MKYVNVALVIFVGLLFLSSCTAEQIKDLADKISGNEANFSGSYALDDGSGLTNTYISFSKGKLYEYRRTDKVILAENYIWGSRASEFSLIRSGEYSISSGILYCNGVPSGQIQIMETQMVLAGQVYQKIITLKEEWYSVITVGEHPTSYSYQKADVQIPVSVNKPIPSVNFIAQKSVSWISRCEIMEGMLCLSLDENNSGYYRTGSVVISYTGAANVTVTIYQLYSSSTIVCEPSSQEVDYLGSNCSLSISITSPREGTPLQISNSYDWITNISPSYITNVQSGGNAISYKISENQSVNPRSGSLSIKYGNFASRTFSITQKGAPVQSLTLNKSELAMKYGDSYTLIALVKPSDAFLNWSSTNTSVATVTQGGLVKAIGNGTATIVVESSDGKKSATCNITVTCDDLSANQTANCYIVSKSSAYKFKTVKGNSLISVGKIASVEVLWESFGTSTTPSKGSIVKNVAYAESSSEILFTTPVTLKNGNAVIAAKDASGNILWSWHIWVCNGYDPSTTAQTYYNSAGVMMDRNLGATSATPGEVGALGLFYQWGRKDPFLGSSSISSVNRAVSTGTWPSHQSSNSSNGTINYSIAHPTTFIAGGSDNYDWYYTGSSSADNTRWQITKTIYDPCPPGWRIPDGGSSGVWSKAVGSSSSFSYSWDSSNKGMNFSGKFGSANTIWYPAAGQMEHKEGKITTVGEKGRWWTVTPSGRYAFFLGILNSGEVNPSDCYYRAIGRSVRCQKEQN